MNLFKKALGKTSEKLGNILKKTKVEDISLEELEEMLILADFGPKMSAVLIDLIENRKVKKDQSIRDVLFEILQPILSSHQKSIEIVENKLNIIIVAGINGSGKTTTIAKLANYYKKAGKIVMLAAADTFRAAAVEQLTLWAQKLKIDIVTGKVNSDPSSVAFRSVDEAINSKADILIIDTSGRLHNKSHLMEELKKLHKVVSNKAPDSNIVNILTLDATSGQNSINQVNVFDEYIKLAGVILTKLDGSAKGGMIFSLQVREEILPIYFVGTGEKLDDLVEFDATDFCSSLLDIKSTENN